MKKRVKSVFDIFWLDEVNDPKMNSGLSNNKLRFYATLKSSFTREPYVDLVESRNQRSFLTRLRCSAHRLEIEKLRYCTPPIPPSARVCGFCSSGEVGDEVHFIMRCQTFNTNRTFFLGKLGSVNQSFKSLSSDQQLKTILCPRSTAEAKIVNKYIHIMSLARDNLSEGHEYLNYPTMPVNLSSFYTDYDDFSDNDEWEESFSSIGSETL